MTVVLEKTTVAEPEPHICPRCSLPFDGGIDACPYCGMSAESEETQPPIFPQGKPFEAVAPRRRLSDNLALVWLLLFTIGPLALPMVWRCRRMALPWKIVWTVLMLTLTALLVFAIWVLVQQSVDPFEQIRLLEKQGY
jgi:hypothetical protein